MYDNNDKLTSAGSGSLSETFAYSLNGNLTSATGNLLGAWSGLTYDDENRLTSVASYPPSGGTESFVYNAFGQRMEATRTAFQCDYYTYAGDRVLQESCPAGVNTQGLYALENGSYYSPLAAEDRCCLPYPRYPVYDALGNVHDLVDQNGAETEGYSWDAFGRDLGDFAWVGVYNFFRYGGGEGYITDTPGAGLIQLGARYYWPQIGRFLQQDPAREGDNWYSYASDDPVTGIDPSGTAGNKRPSKGPKGNGRGGGNGGKKCPPKPEPKKAACDQCWSDYGWAVGKDTAVAGAIIGYAWIDAGVISGGTLGVASPEAAAGAASTTALTGIGWMVGCDWEIAKLFWCLHKNGCSLLPPA